MRVRIFIRNINGKGHFNKQSNRAFAVSAHIHCVCVFSYRSIAQINHTITEVKNAAGDGRRTAGAARGLNVQLRRGHLEHSSGL